jgi:hypothetical protein
MENKNKLIAEFMGYTFFQEKVTIEGEWTSDIWDVYSKVPIETDYIPEYNETYFAQQPNPDYEKVDPINWNPDIKFLSWESLNYGKYLTNLKYSTSWDWLIPVVEKIESLDLSEYGYKWEDMDGETRYNNQNICVEIERNQCWIYMNLQLDPLHTINAETFNKKCDSKIDAVYGAVVEFIEWYNTISKKD